MNELIDRQKLSRAERLAFIGEHGRAVYATLDRELAQMQLRRQLDVNCPDCGRHQAAGHYCYHCYLPLLASEWYDRRPLAAERARAAMSDTTREAFAQARLRMAAGRVRPVEDETAEELGESEDD